MSSDGWGGDYSFLLQSIEGKISENMSKKSPEPNATPVTSAREDSTTKRRWSDFQSPGGDLTITSSKKLKSLLEMDELVLENEQLRDNLARLKSEQQIAREEHIRQIKFLDERCTSLKKESTERLEKYYEEKKKWQSKHRELEIQLKKVSASAPAFPAASTMSTPSTKINNGNDEIAQRLRALEVDLHAKVRESLENLKGRQEAESKLFEMETELRTFRSSFGSGTMADEAMEEARTLRKQFSDLESVHKRTVREHESMKTKLKNQSLLEEEVSALKARLRLVDEKLSAFKQGQIEHQQLQEEKSIWGQLFQDIVAHPEHSAMLDDPSLTKAPTTVSPTSVLQLLSAYQSRCALLLQGQGQLQQSLSELRRQARDSKALQLNSEAALQDVQTRLETTEHQLRTAQQQGRLYDGEVKSLRSLLETYDLEFQIGKPDAVKVMALKDQLIQELRSELDSARGSAMSFATQLKTAEAEAAEKRGALVAAQVEISSLRTALAAANSADPVAAPTSADEAPTRAVRQSDASSDIETLTLRAQLDAARYDALYLQHTTGLDFYPDRTRVLHMPVNPTAGFPAVCTLPSVSELHQQRRKHRAQLVEAAQALLQAQELVAEQLQQQQQQQANDSSSNSSNTSSGGGVNTSVLGGLHNASSSQQQQVAPAADSATMNIRLKEQFKERIASFREGVYLLMGYKVDLYAADGSPNSLPRLRLRSMFAEKSEDYLLFQMRGDCPELLDTEFAARLDPSLLRYLTDLNSVPAFVAAVTLNLFESQTFMG